MGKISELEKYLRSQETEGRKDSEGVFSISREQAVKKLAGFQLPFEGAWALKIVQAAVADGGCHEIKVTLGRSEQRFDLKGVQSWSLEALESGLLNPDSSSSRSLEHLIAGLRGVGFSDLRGFWLGLPGESEALTWDAENLGRLRMETQISHPILIVTCKAKFEDGGFFGFSDYKAARERNATVEKIVSTTAYTSPVPLYLDGRRIDGFELDPRHGWGKASQLVALGFEEGDLPALKLPAGDTNVHLWGHPVETTLQQVTADFRRRPSTRKECAVAYLVSAHLERVQSGKSSVWKEREACSHCNWVADGVVVQSDVVDKEASFCSTGWYLSADDLETDLTSLSLRSGPEKERRFKLSVGLVENGLRTLAELELSKISEIERSSTRTGAVFFFVLGAGISFLSPVHGAACMGMGAFGLYASGRAGKRLESLLGLGLEGLQRKIQQLNRRL